MKQNMIHSLCALARCLDKHFKILTPHALTNKVNKCFGAKRMVLTLAMVNLMT